MARRRILGSVPPVERWATFDCYGTLVDWRAGIGGQLARLFGSDREAELLERYYVHEAELEEDGALGIPGGDGAEPGGLAAETGQALPDDERDALGEVAPRLAGVSRRPGGARGGPSARLAARDPLQHRPRSDRRVDRRDRRAVRPLDRRLRDRLVQAGPPTLAGVRRAGRASLTATSTWRRACTTITGRHESSGSRRSGSTGSGEAPDPRPTVTLSGSTVWRTRSRRSARMTMLRPVTLGDADAIADVMNAFAISHVGRAAHRRGRPATLLDLDRRRGTSSATPSPRSTRTVTSRATATSAIRAATERVLWLDVRGDPQQVVRRRARASRARTGRGGRVLRAVDVATETEYQAFLAERGFRHVRRATGCERAWRRARAAGRLARRARCSRRDARTRRRWSHDVYQETFAEHAWFVPEPFDEFDHHVSNVMPDRSLWFVAEDEGEVAGIADLPPARRGRPDQRLGRRSSACGHPGGGAGSAARCCCTRSPSSAAGPRPGRARRRRRQHDGRGPALRARRHDDRLRSAKVWESRHVSTPARAVPRLPHAHRGRAGRGYECHACGATFAAGLVRVPRAWGEGGEAMAEAALSSPLAVPGDRCRRGDDAGGAERGARRAAAARPLVLGGCCCAHIGAIRGLAARHGRLAVVWFDAHGDLNTPETSPSGNPWGMPLRMAIDEGSVDPGRGRARRRAQPRPARGRVSCEAAGIDDDVGARVDGADAVYVALDVDVLDPSEIDCFMPEPDGPDGRRGRELDPARIAGSTAIAGLGFTGARTDDGDRDAPATRDRSRSVAPPEGRV